MRNEKARTIVLPLAAVAQSAHLVHSIAHTGKMNWDNSLPLLNSVLQLDAPSVTDVYGGIQHLRNGLQILIDQLNLNAPRKERQVGRYIANLLNLERQLSGNADLLATLGIRIQQSQRLRTHMPDDNDALVVSLAGIYTDTISPLPLRIKVLGEAKHLQNKDNQNRVRALLLAGLRSAVLWRQVGGKRRQFLISRSALIKAATQLLSEIR